MHQTGEVISILGASFRRPLVETRRMLGLGSLQDLIDQTGSDLDNFTLLKIVRDTLNLTNVAYFAQHLPPLTNREPYIEVTYPQAWIDHYKAKKYVEIDPVLREPMKTILPTDWSTLPRATPRVRQMFADAETFGVGHQGLTIPIRGPRGELAFFSVTMDIPDCEWKLFLRSNLPTLQIVAHFYHDRVLEQHGIRTPNVHLSPRELDVLRWAANGKAVQDTAAILDLSSHTVQTYLEMARTKLQALNTSHAVARALALALIPPPD
jgi:DNA-binding CsgD family transcriptional regulator